MATNRRLNVPMVPQIEEFYCVPACISMVIRYLNNEILSEPAPDLPLLEIAKIVHTQDGTWAPDVKNMNPVVEVAIPSVEFDGEFKVHSLSEIAEEISNRRPCIPIMKLTDGIKWAWHAVVVTHIDIEGNQISFNDPQYNDARFGQKTLRLSLFDALWQAALTTLIKIQIGQKTRTVLTQFK
jgi:hypothetical protein